MSLRTTTGATLAALFIATAAHAADITIKKDGCNPVGCYNINITGEIKIEDAKRFEAVVKANDIKTAAVYLDSPGGNVLGGLIIGLSIHTHKFTTVVDYNGRCVSICASMWMAGDKKIVVTNAKIGFHQPYVLDRRGRPHVLPQAVALMKQYYARVGVPKPAADFFLAADPKDAYWLNGDLAAGFGIEVTTVEAAEPPKTDNQPGTTAPILPPELIPPGTETRTATLPKAFIEQLTNPKPL
jgi:hypothetical protein